MIEKEQPKYNYKGNDPVFWTSDTHFSHRRIIEYTNRPFSSIEEMNEALIRNWNSVVPENGTVFHLGDFAFGTPAQWEEIRSRLNGHIHLILGNHDLKNWTEHKERLLEIFDSVCHKRYVQVGNRRFLMNHEPLLTYSGVYREKNPVIQLFGHCHLSTAPRGLDTTRLEVCFPTQYDVGVDLNNFTPISYHKLVERIELQRETSTNVMRWTNVEQQPDSK